MRAVVGATPFSLRKFGNRLEACRSLLVGAGGPKYVQASIGSTLAAFVAVILLPILILAALAFALSGHVDHAALMAFPYAIGTVKDMREKRANLAEQAKAILDKAEAEKRELSTEESQSFDKIHADIDKLGKDVERIERQESIDRELAASRGTRAGRENRSVGPNGDVATVTDAEKQERARKQDEAFDSYLRYGIQGLEPEQRNMLRYVAAGRDSAVNETRAAQTVSTTGGGYLIPQGFSGKLEESLKAYGGVESVADVFETETGNTLPWPTVDDTSNTGRLLAINTGATQTGITYGQVSFGAYKFSSDYILVPVELMQDSAFDLGGHIASVLATRLGRVHNTYQTTGTGSSQPKGIVVGASSGVTAAGTSTVTADEVLDLIHSVDPAYRNPAFGTGFMFNDGTLKILRKLKDGEGRYLWQAGVGASSPDTLFGYPYLINQDMDAMTTGLKPILFGALKKFKVRKVKGFTLIRLDERFAELHQIGYLAFTRMDSNMLDSGTDPCKYITMA